MDFQSLRYAPHSKIIKYANNLAKNEEKVCSTSGLITHLSMAIPKPEITQISGTRSVTMLDLRYILKKKKKARKMFIREKRGSYDFAT